MYAISDVVQQISYSVQHATRPKGYCTGARCIRPCESRISQLSQSTFPFHKTFSIAGGSTDAQTSVLIKIVADNGLAGIGEGTPCVAYSEETQATVVHVIKDILTPALLGQDPLRLDALDALMNHVIDGHPLAKGGVSLALYDLAGKALGLSAYQFFWAGSASRDSCHSSPR